MPIASTCSIGYPHDGRADNAAYRHDRRADNAAYRHDRRADSLSHGIRTQLLPLNGRTRYGYTYTQNSSPIYWGVKLTNHVELLLLMSVWLDCCLSFQEMLK